MFSFFSKKHFLVDYLDGFIDIHNHILPGIDDGAKKVEDSVELIKGFGEFGVTDFICTPHIMENYYPNNPTTIIQSLSTLQNELKMQGMEKVNVSAAAEHMIDSGFEKLLESNKMMPLAQHYILIEMSYLQPSINFDESLDKIKNKGLFPILAHPERYVYLTSKRKIYEYYKSQDIFFQLNILSLGGYYGKQIHKIAFKLLEDDKFDFVASDTHKLQHLNAIKNVVLADKHLSKVTTLIERTKNTFN